jgi:hypothetical protein
MPIPYIHRVQGIVAEMGVPDWGIDPDTTTGLTYGYRGGTAQVGVGPWTQGANGTVALAPNATNYVERDAAGAVYVHQGAAFTPARTPMARITTNQARITDYQDWRPRGAPAIVTPAWPARSYEPPVLDMTEPYGYAQRYGADVDAADNAGVLDDIVQAFGSANALEAANGGVITLPFGRLRTASPLTINGNADVTIVGQGANILKGFKRAPSEIEYTGADARFMHVTSNWARGFRLKDVAIRYSNPLFTGTLLELSNVAAMLENVALFNPQLDGAGDLFSAGTLLRISTDMELALFDRVYFGGAVEAVRFATGAGNVRGPITFTRCWVYDMAERWIVTEALNDLVLAFHGCGFDQLFRPCTGYGIDVACRSSFQDCRMIGQHDMQPQLGTMRLRGNARMTNSEIRTFYNALRLEGVQMHMETCVVHQGEESEFLPGESNLTGGNNRWYGLGNLMPLPVRLAAPLVIAPGYAGVGQLGMQYGPDIVDGNHDGPIDVPNPAGGSGQYEYIHGQYRYDRQLDGSFRGPRLGAAVEIVPVSPRSIQLNAAALVLTWKDAGAIVQANAGVAMTITLPKARPGMFFIIQKGNVSNVKVLADATIDADHPAADQILLPGTGFVPDLDNVTAGDLFAEVKLVAYFNPAIGFNMWRIERASGTWA